MVPSRGRVYAFGLGGVGQLGNKMAKNASTPQIVVGPWLPDSKEEKYSIRRIYSGGDHAFITVSKAGVSTPYSNSLSYTERLKILPNY